MGDPIITNNDLGSVLYEGGHVQDEIFESIGALELLEGTILARDDVSLKLALFVKGGVVRSNGIPVAVLTFPVSKPDGTDITLRPHLTGSFIASRLVIAADGDASNIDKAVRDELRTFGLLTVDTQELNQLDNQ